MRACALDNGGACLSCLCYSSSFFSPPFVRGVMKRLFKKTELLKREKAIEVSMKCC